MIDRISPRQFDTAGAADGDALVYDPATDTYGPGALPPSGVSSIVAGSGISVDATDANHPIVSVTGTSLPYREVLMASGVSFPAEPMETSTGGDWLYGEAS